MSFVEASLDSESDDFARRSIDAKSFVLVAFFDETPNVPKGDVDDEKLGALKADLDVWGF